MSMREESPESGQVLQSTVPLVSRFGVEVRTKRQATVLTLTGELDHDSAPLLRERFDDVFDAAEAGGGSGQPRFVVVDCAELGFCDSTGLNTLLTARLRGEEVGVGIRLAALRGHVVRMFEITGVGGVFSIHPDLADALAAG
jgi:anti-anti-sigma factor